MRELALFAGAGGGILGGHLLGWRTICAVEYDPYAASVLCARQNDGVLPPFPIWDDVRSFRGTEWRGCVDVVSGGFPCQDISSAGRGAGITGARSGLWSEMARIVGEVQPQYVFVENSPNLVRRGLITVLSNLASLGYDARWLPLRASDLGADHRRERLWLVAHTNKELECSRLRRIEHGTCGGGAIFEGNNSEGIGLRRRIWLEMADKYARNDDGVAPWLDRASAVGNGQVPAVAAMAWQILTARTGEDKEAGE